MKTRIHLVVLAAISFLTLNTMAAAADSGSANFHFRLSIGDGPDETFARCYGMGSSNEVTEHKVVLKDSRELVRKIPGRLKFNDITCVRDIQPKASSIWTWRSLVEGGYVDKARRNIVLTLYSDDRGDQVAQWQLLNAWPSSLSVSTENQPQEVLVLSTEGSSLAQ